MESPAAPVRIELWSDVVCPFCWIGKRHLEEAVRQLGVEGEVEIVQRAYQLNPEAKESRPLREYLTSRFGGEEGARGMTSHVQAMGRGAGLMFDFENAIFAPTRDAHRIIRLAAKSGRGDEMSERLMKAHFAEAADVSHHATLRRLAEEVGLSAEDVERVLASDEFAAEVRDDALQAQAIGARGVPFFVIDRRYGISGAQPVEAFMDVLERVRSERAAAESRSSDA